MVLLFIITNFIRFHMHVNPDVQYSATSAPPVLVTQPLSADQYSLTSRKNNLIDKDSIHEAAVWNQVPAPLTIESITTVSSSSATGQHQLPLLPPSSTSIPSLNFIAPYHASHLMASLPVTALPSSSSSLSPSPSPSPRPPPSSFLSSSSSSRVYEDSGKLATDTSKQKLGFLDAIRGMDASTLR